MNTVTQFSGHVGTTVKYTSTDTSQALTLVAGCIGAMITLETEPIRYGYGITPTNDAGTALGHVMLPADTADTPFQPLHLRSGREVTNFRFISKVGAAHGVLHVTQFTEKG